MPAVLFDMDGVISDSQEPVAILESEQLAKHGIHLTPSEITRRFAGVSDPVFYTEVFSAAGKSANINELVTEKWRLFLTQMQGRIKEIPGARNTVIRLHEAGFPLAIASSSIPEFIKLVVHELGLDGIFQTLTSGTEVTHGKPAPDVFLLAAKRVDTTPEQCVVIEDAINGMTAARRAGMKCIGLIQPHLAKMHDELPADIIVDSHSNITPALIRHLVK